MARFKKRSNAARKAYFKAYKETSTGKKNADRRLAKHIKKHPTDKQSANHVVPVYTKTNS